VRETDLAGAWPAPATDEPGVTDGVVGRAKWARAHQRLVVAQLTGHRIDAGDVQRFAEGEAGQDRGQGAGQQRFARARRTSQTAVVTAGAGDLQRPLSVFLTLDIHVKQRRVTPYILNIEVVITSSRRYNRQKTAMLLLQREFSEIGNICLKESEL
jgi:hypothetical protein